MSSLAITDRPFTFAVKADGVSSWTAYLQKEKTQISEWNSVDKHL
jgi:hypothetical protein